MNVLMLTPYLPYPLLSGGQIRTYNLLKKLSRHHQITLFALIKDNDERAHIKELEKYCQTVKVFKRSNTPFTLSNIIKTGFSSFPFLVIRNRVPEVIGSIQQELSRRRYDLIHAETFYMMPHIPKTSIPTLLVEQTIEYLGYESYARKTNPLVRPLLGIDIKKIKRWEKHYWQHCHKLVVMSDDDKRLIQKQGITAQKIAVVENGVDTRWFAAVPHQPNQRPTLLFVGTFKWLPNIEAVDFLTSQVWPLVKKRLTNAQLLIVGNEPTAKIQALATQDPAITVTGRVEDIRTAFAQAHVLVAPVFSGKGTRYKVLEAMAAGTPIVATPTAVEGLNVVPGTHVVTGTTAEALAEGIVTVLLKPDLQAKLARHGRQFVAKHYDWSLIAKKLDTIYQDMGKQHAAAR